MRKPVRAAAKPAIGDLDLPGRQFQYGRVDEAIYGHRMMLLHNGKIACYRQSNEHRWEQRPDVLVFRDRDGLATTRFDELTHVDGRLRLEGWHAGDLARHYLLELETLGVKADDATSADLLQTLAAQDADATRPPRRNLVLMRAGPTSVHRDWARDLPADDRSWDLAISWYGPADGFEPDDTARYHLQQPDLQKWQAIHALSSPSSPLWRYDFVAFPDDDLAWSWRGINIAFERMRDFDLLLGQPSLDPAGNIIHAITRQNPGTCLRYTNFVEVMAPIFSREALSICAPSFALSRSGFGLDHLWPKLLGEPEHRIGIIDDTSIVHTRPQAQTYDMGEAIAEGRALTERFAAFDRYDEVGRILSRF